MGAIQLIHFPFDVYSSDVGLHEVSPIIWLYPYQSLDESGELHIKNLKDLHQILFFLHFDDIGNGTQESYIEV